MIAILSNSPSFHTTHYEDVSRAFSIETGAIRNLVALTQTRDSGTVSYQCYAL